MDWTHTLDGATRGTMVVSSIGWAVITYRVLWLSRVKGSHHASAEVILPIIMSIGSILWSISDALAWADMQAAGIQVSASSVWTRVAACITVAASTLRFAKFSGYLTTELTTRRIVDGALEHQQEKK